MSLSVAPACELASAQHDKVKVKMDKVNSKIKEKTDGKTKKTKLALSEATDKLKKTSKRLCELQVSISTAERFEALIFKHPELLFPFIEN